MRWPALPLDEWGPTCETLHRWTQIVGKVRMQLTPKLNHWWNVPLYVSARGLTTSVMHYGERSLEIEFDLVEHLLRVRTSDGSERRILLEPRSVSDVHAAIFDALASLGIEIRIWPVPVEIDNPIPLDRDQQHHDYDRDAASRFNTILSSTHAVFERFRSEFLGKCSPVHFFWGSFDLAVTRFSGRPAPPREGADAITSEAYSHEVSSVGFWPGDQRLPLPSFYSYAAPEPDGFRDTPATPPQAYYNASLGGFYLHYDEMRESSDPDQTLLDFCRSTYAAAADRGRWDRAALERKG
jgi:hypothetical protein